MEKALDVGRGGRDNGSLYDAAPAGTLSSRSRRLRLLAVNSEAVRRAINREAQGDWLGKQESPDIDAFLLKAIDDLGSDADLLVERVEIENYGYASFMSAFVGFRDPTLWARALERSHSSLGVVGLNVLLCRLAPFACISSPSRIGENFGTLTSQGEFLTDDHTEWLDLGKGLVRVIRDNEIEPLPPCILDQQVDSELSVDTNLGEPSFTVFDAWFNWSD